MIKENADSDAIIAIVENKCDLYENEQVINEEGKEFAKSIGTFFQSISSKKDIGITPLFGNIRQKFFNPNYNQKLQ